MIQMIKGMDVTLYTNGTAETVSNVLVGEPVSGGYTIAVPKGDEHDWTDKAVGFFGQIYRTVGLPEQGIEENIPLQWHKKIKAELMKISGSCTVYEKDTFGKHIFRDVFFTDERGTAVQKDGIRTAGKLNIKIYSASGRDSDYVPKPGDIVVCGECSFEFDGSSQKSASESMTQFRRECPEYGVISSVSHEICGKLPDYSIIAG